MMKSRRIRIPLVLLWALAHGVWIGAGWHAGTQVGFNDTPAASTQNSCSCEWRPSAKNTAQIARVQVSAAQRCAVCELGLVAPEMPAVFQVVTVAPHTPARKFVSSSTEISATPTVLPPSRAPPIAIA